MNLGFALGRRLELNRGVTTLLLIRHGQTTSNEIGALDTAIPGADLTELGRRQAQDLVARLDDQRIDRIATSLQARTAQTAAPLASARGLEPLRERGFGEISAGDYEMHATREAADAYLETALAWAKGDLTPRLPGGEAGSDVLARFDAALSSALDGLGEEDVLVVVAHGAILRLWVTSQTSGITPEDVEHRRLPNTTILRVEGRPGGWHFKGWSEPRLLDASAPDPTSVADVDDENDEVNEG